MKFSIYIPSKSPTLANVPQKQLEITTLDRLSELCGGATSIDGKGAWIGKEGLVIEDVKIVYTFGEEKHKKEILAYAEKMCILIEQECVLVEIDNKPYFITPKILENVG